MRYRTNHQITRDATVADWRLSQEHIRTDIIAKKKFEFKGRMSVVVVDAFYYLFCAYRTIDGDWIAVDTPDHIREAHASQIEESFSASSSLVDLEHSTNMKANEALRDASRMICCKRKNAAR
jgi:hypothetical protein